MALSEDQENGVQEADFSFDHGTSEVDYSAMPGSINGQEDALTFGGSDTSQLISQQSRPQGTSGWIGAIFLIVNAALGAGILNIPSAFNDAGGIVISMIVQVILCGFATISLLVLAYCAEKHSCTTYQEVVLRTCGRKFERVCASLIALYCYGTCITFFVIIGDIAERIMFSRVGPDFCHSWFMTREFMICSVAIFLILPLCFPKQIDFLKYPSLGGVLAVLFIVGLIVYEYFYGGYPVPDEIRTRPENWTDVLTVVPVICFGYQCHVSSVPIYACMEDKRVSSFARSILVAIGICVVVYTFVGICGYLTFGTDVDADILEAYDAKQTIIFIGLVAIAFKIVTTYPLLMFCGRLGLEDLLPKSWIPSTTKGRLFRRLSISFLWFFSSLILACTVPSLQVVISSVGSMAALFIFVFPALALLQTRIKADELYQQWSTRFVIVYTFANVALGTLIFGQVLGHTVWSFVTGEGAKNRVIFCV